MTNNPLIVKWEELHNPKKEEPKKVEYELAPEFVKQLENRFTLPTDPTTKKLPSLITYDPGDLKISFQQVADKIQQGKANVASMSMEVDSMSIMRNKIIFEVYVDDY
jgi:hypothetical protein